MLKNHEINALTEQEAEESRKKYGSNMLTPPEQTSFWHELWETFRGDALIRILTVALIITVVFAILGVGDCPVVRHRDGVVQVTDLKIDAIVSGD